MELMSTLKTSSRVNNNIGVSFRLRFFLGTSCILYRDKLTDRDCHAIVVSADKDYQSNTNKYRQKDRIPTCDVIERVCLEYNFTS